MGFLINNKNNETLKLMFFSIFPFHHSDTPIQLMPNEKFLQPLYHADIFYHKLPS